MFFISKISVNRVKKRITMHRAYMCFKHRASLASGVSSSCQNCFYYGFCLCGEILNLKAFCFGAIPDIMIELIAYWSVPRSRQSWQWLSGIETKLLGASGYWQKKS
jgi:hypothetical protein